MSQFSEVEDYARNFFVEGYPPTAGNTAVLKTNFTITPSAPFAELMVTWQFTAPNQRETIMCLAVLIEKPDEQVNTAVSYLPLALAAYSGLVSLVSTFMRASVGNGLLGATATYGLVTEPVNVHSPGFFDIIFYAQFMLMTGQLSLNYPSFYSTFTSLFHWSFLEFRNSFAGKGPDNSTEVLTYGGAGSVNIIKDTAYQNQIQNQNKRSLHELFVDPSVEIFEAPTPRAYVSPQVTVADNWAPRTIDKRQLQETPVTTIPSVSAPVTKPPSPSPTPPSIPPPPSPTSSSSKTKSRSKTPTTAAANTTTSTVTATYTPTSTSSPIIPNVRTPFDRNSNIETKRYNVSRFGIEAYAAAIGADPSDLFLCTFINTILAGGVSLFLSAFYLVIAWVKAKESNVLRVWTLFFTPLALSAMYQLTISGRTVMMAIASASLLILSVGVTVFLTWRILHASSKLLLFEDIATLLKYGPIYSTLTEEGTLFFLVTLLVRFLWALTVAMLSSYGVAQIAVLLVIELGYMVVIGFKWPYAESSENKFHIFLGTIRIAVIGCSIAYVHDLSILDQDRQMFGYIQMALHLTAFIVMFALAKWNTILVIIFWRTRHDAFWKGPKSNYSFEDPVDADHDWVLTGRPRSAPPGRDPTLEAIKARRYTVQPYTSIPDIRCESMGPGGEAFQPRSPRDLYRRSLHHGERRSRFPSDDDGLMLDVRSEAVIPLSSSAGPMSARSTSPHPHSTNGSIESADEPVLPLQQAQPSVRFQPQRESYAKFERMNHQQAVIDPRTRRMSDIFKDGPYVYQGAPAASSTQRQPSKEKQGLWSSMKTSLGGYLSFGKGSIKRAASDGTKPKAFEVIRPQRPPPVRDATNDNASQMGGDNLRELNSIGIGRFFQESGRAYEKNRSLFVANPEALASRAGSVRSSLSVRPKLERGETGTSVYTLGQGRPKNPNISTDRGSILTGMGSSVSELGISDSRRVSAAHPRNSVESNIAEALMTEAPLRLQGGGILKVSKGPEKAVQYWHKESGQYIGTPEPSEPRQSQNLTSPSLLLLPTTRNSNLFDTIQKEPRQPSIKSKAGSRPDSPTESHHSHNPNVAVSAGRMHEILDRMFSDPDDTDDSISEDEETCSTFSGKVSAAIMALKQRKNQEESELDAQSLYRSDILEPVLEHADADMEGVRGTLKRAASATDRPRAGMTLIRTYTGPTKSPSSSSLRQGQTGVAQRPLAQTPLHSPSVMPFSGSTASLHHPSLTVGGTGVGTGLGSGPGTLSRQSSRQSSLSRQSSQHSIKSTTSRSTTDPLGAIVEAKDGATGTILNNLSRKSSSRSLVRAFDLQEPDHLSRS
ncbi:hypothetical protein BG006_001051 [Podila minutissima]|uniref:TRP C-terminal domain-containing protein n=1 Tax=Podila minutissima TaxID=64525 RepID=A0A9P5VHA1_9FUNG|nr:hypothetical protein BG006_001051 [Podila minutissima]